MKPYSRLQVVLGVILMVLSMLFCYALVSAGAEYGLSEFERFILAAMFFAAPMGFGVFAIMSALDKRF